MEKQALWGLLCMVFFNHALSGTNDAIIVSSASKPFYNEGVMGNDIQKVAEIIFDDDCLLYLCTPGMGVNMLKARASP
jgi:hypothetical protein